MSKAMRGGLLILGVLLIVSVGVAVYALILKQSSDQEVQILQTRFDDSKTEAEKLASQATKLKKEMSELSERIKDREREKDQVQQSFDDIKVKYDELNSQLNQATQDRDDSRSRLETIRRERDELMERLRSQPEKVVEKIVYRDREPGGGDVDQPQPSGYAETANDTANMGQQPPDKYWAQVLKDKAALQLDLEKAKADLDQSALQVVELKKQNAEIQLELKNLTDSKQDVDKDIQNTQEEYERKLRYSEELANSLSMEVAKARSEQKEASDRLEKAKQDTMEYQKQIRDLNTTKLALDRTIAQMNQEKIMMQRKLAETQGAIQGRINEIWRIKESLDNKISQLPDNLGAQASPVRRLSSSATATGSQGPSGESPAAAALASVTGDSEVELPPIIVNATAREFSDEEPATQSKGTGKIISINEPNNFAIIDLGEGDGSQIGRKLVVQRNNSKIGALQVIQVRKDISAADIKQANVKLRVGDVVHY